MRKLLPAVRDEETWRLIDAQIASWYEALTIRNFWNAVHGISLGFHLTNFVSWITSVNIKWEERDVSVDDLWFGSRRLADTLMVEESAPMVREGLFLSEHTQLRTEEQEKNEEILNSTAPRDQFPIFVIRKDKNRLRVVDGNTRLLHAIFSQKTTIRAVVGEPIGGSVFSEQWVPTSLLVDVVFWHEQQGLLKRDTTQACAVVIAELIRDSSAGQKESGSPQR